MCAKVSMRAVKVREEDQGFSELEGGKEREEFVLK